MPDETLPLIHQEDSYVLVLSVEEKTIRLSSIVRYENNQNSNGDLLRFFDLDEQTRGAIIRQIRRRHADKTLSVQ